MSCGVEVVLLAAGGGPWTWISPSSRRTKAEVITGVNCGSSFAEVRTLVCFGAGSRLLGEAGRIPGSDFGGGDLQSGLGLPVLVLFATSRINAADQGIESREKFGLPAGSSFCG